MIHLQELNCKTLKMAKYDKLPLLNESEISERAESLSYGTSSQQNIEESNKHVPDNRDYEVAKNRNFVYILSFFSAIGGFLFGYDTGVVSGALILLKDEFSLSTVSQELFVSITIGTAAIGALISGKLNEACGRRPVILTASIVFTIGAIILGIALNEWMLLLGRAVLGIAIGFASMTVPIYIAECAPTDLRGRLVVLNQLCITGGQFSAAVVDGLFSNVDQGWRYMLGLAGLPAVIQLIGFIFMPESPRWLVGRNRIGDATSVMKRIRGTENVSAEIQQIQKNIEEAHSVEIAGGDGRNIVVRSFTTATVRRAIFVGCMLQVFQQISGINTVMYYSASIIKMAGVRDNSTAIWMAAGVASINFIFTIVGICLVDRIGRRKLTLGSLIGTMFSLAVLGMAFQLAAVNSPHSTYVTPTLGETATYDCEEYTNCDSCVLDENCGFCFSDDNGAINGSCVAAARDRDTDNPDPTHAGYGMCSKKSLPEGVIWGYEYCPTKFAALALTGLILYLAFFAPGMGPMPWTINSEIYPLWARSFGMSLSTTTNWIFNLLISMTFLTLTETITRYGAFYLYTGFAFVGCIFVFIFVPETLGKSLEQVDQLFARPWCSKHN